MLFEVLQEGHCLVENMHAVFSTKYKIVAMVTKEAKLFISEELLNYNINGNFLSYFQIVNNNCFLTTMIAAIKV